MKHARKLLLIVALMATAACSIPAPSHAARPGVAGSATQAASPGAPTTESWWGGAAAIGCGLGIRYGGALGGWGIAATVVLCLIALADAV